MPGPIGSVRVGVLTGLLWLYLPIRGVGQVAIAPPAPDNARLLDALPLNSARRATLEAAMRSRDYTRAEVLLVEEIERQPKSGSLLVFLGNILFLDGQYLNCTIAMKKAEALGPLHEQNRFILALAYIAIDKGDWARPELERLAQSSPSSALYPYWLSRLAYNKMRLEEAVAHAQKAIQLDPQLMKAYDNLGLSYEGLGKVDDAIAAYEEAIRLNRQLGLRSPWPSMNLGKLLFRLDRFEEAEGRLRESINIDPRFPKAHFRLGQVLEKQGKIAEAIRELEEAASLDPSYPEPHYALGRIHRLRGETKSAERAFRMFAHLRQEQKKRGADRLE
jgi:tetratricopeptide (TPR) repeat protein